MLESLLTLAPAQYNVTREIVIVLAGAVFRNELGSQSPG